MNCTLLEKTQSMLFNFGLHKKFWAETVNYASHLINQLLFIAIGGKIVKKIWSRKLAQDYNSIRVFERFIIK